MEDEREIVSRREGHALMYPPSGVCLAEIHELKHPVNGRSLRLSRSVGESRRAPLTETLYFKGTEVFVFLKRSRGPTKLLSVHTIVEPLNIAQYLGQRACREEKSHEAAVAT